eukprot:TRINITY_DN36877_c0_g1_i1.p1 TRINITY_DN36877_c0_g1~~TRINITY_DN36877_c0_g1_i1.p1  ORF type:complete len:407 (+),score=87.75 TRINITY_DN36877_c0_g1_i1:31-1221(+)
MAGRQSITKETLLGRYVIQKSQVLGTGAFATVYAGLDLTTGRNLAIKVYKEDDEVAFGSLQKSVAVFTHIGRKVIKAGGTDMWTRNSSCDNGVLVDELLRKLSKENAEAVQDLVQNLDMESFFVELIDYSKSETGHPGIDDATGQLFLILERGEGSLSTKIDFGVDQLRGLLWSLLCTMWALHTAGFVHTDVKPENFVYFRSGSGGGRWKLVDLDDVKLAGEMLPLEKCAYTPLYASPEFALADVTGADLKISRTMDAWAIGLVGMEVIFKQPVLGPWYEQWSKETGDDKKYFAWLSNFGTEPIVSGEVAEAIASKYDSEIADLLEGLLRKDPQERLCIPRCIVHDCFNSIRSKLRMKHETLLQGKAQAKEAAEDKLVPRKTRKLKATPSQVCSVM